MKCYPAYLVALLLQIRSIQATSRVELVDEADGKTCPNVIYSEVDMPKHTAHLYHHYCKFPLHYTKLREDGSNEYE